MDKRIIALWGIGILFVVVGFNALSANVLGGLIYIIGGISLLPLTHKIVGSLSGKQIAVKWFVIFSLASFLIAPLIINATAERFVGTNKYNQVNLKEDRSTDQKKRTTNPEMTEIKVQRMAREFVSKYLKDPTSAEFRNQKGFCGEVNAKNSFGGYTGYRKFIATDKNLVVMEGDLTASEFEQLWINVCK